MNGAMTQSSAPLSIGQASRSEGHYVAGGEYNIAFAYLRAFIIVLVVVHHSVIAYLFSVAPPPAFSLAGHLRSLRAISPIIDVAHSRLFFFVVFFNDRFFMSLMFFLSGLFVWKSLQRKGILVFFRDRLIRLGLPFVVMAVLAPFTYYTTYLYYGGGWSLSAFWRQWISLSHWPTGPAWFIWLLLAFDTVVILLSALIPGRSSLLDKVPSAIVNRPAAFFLLLVIVSAGSYIPMASIYDPSFAWWYWGPFSFQISRVFLYLVYFLFGVILGAYGIQRTLLVPDSTLARRWFIWTLVAMAAFLANIAATLAGANRTLIGITYLLVCAAASTAFLAVFLRFAVRRNRILDSLYLNSYGIYVIHYAVVSWLLYAILNAPLPGIAKGSIVFVCALTFCWGTISLIRRIPGVARII
ncbi:MAG: acyltransferase [Syntrophobacteraceae bacterium]|jgi:peptidoglycan/LPS O-acetylase OafA/YrhL